jgi:hypothetical protein
MARDYPGQTLSFAQKPDTGDRPEATPSFWLKHDGPPGVTGRADAADTDPLLFGFVIDFQY